MKLRITLVVERELSDQRAHEEYRSVDPATVASAMTVEAHEWAREKALGRDGLTVVGAVVEPVYG